MHQTESTIRILIVDDHPVVRLGLVGLIHSEPDMEVVAEGRNGLQSLELFRRHAPDVVIMDLRLPGMNGIEATKDILREFPQARIIVLSSFASEEDIYRALQSGAHAYLIKDTVQEELLVAIKKVRAGGRYLSPEAALKLAGRTANCQLTDREMDVLRLIAEGKSNKEIGYKLGVAQNTVKIHIQNIMGKMNVNDRTLIVMTALQRGLIHID